MKADTPEGSAGRLEIGETLRQAREGRGWSIQDVASQLNLTRQIIGTLEAGDLQSVPHTFARGYLRAYAKLLGLDPQRIALEFDRCTGTTAAAGASVQQLSRIDEPVRGSQRVLRLVSTLLALALLAGGFYWWQQHSPEYIERSAIPEHIEVESADGTTQLHPLTEPEDAALAEIQGETSQPPEDLSAELAGSAAPDAPDVPQESAALASPAPGEVAAPAASPQPAPQPGADTGAAMASPAPAQQISSAPAADAAGTASATPIESTAAVTPPATPEVAPAAAQADAPVAPEPAAAGEGEGLLEITFSETCWIEVTDGRGKVLHSALNRKGESLRLIGKTPLKLHLGFAKAAQVRFNGQAVDVTSHARGETARLILGQ